MEVKWVPRQKPPKHATLNNQFIFTDCRIPPRSTVECTRLGNLGNLVAPCGSDLASVKTGGPLWQLRSKHSTESKVLTLDLRMLWRKKLLVFLCTIGTVAAGGIYLLLVQPTYEAEARVLVVRQGVEPEAEPERRPDPEFLPTQAETIRSPVTVVRALESVDITPPRFADAEKFEPVRHVLKSLTVTPVLRANVLTVSYRSANPDEALELLSSVVAAYREHVSEVDQGDSETNIQVVATREIALRTDLEDAQRAYDELHRQSPFIGEGREANAQALAELNQLGEQIAELRLNSLDLQAKLAILPGQTVPPVAGTEPQHDSETTVVALKPITSTRNEMVDHVLRFINEDDARALEALDERCRFARLRTTNLDQVYGPRHPDLVAARAELGEYELLLQQRLTDIIERWRRQLRVMETTERKLVTAYEAQRKKTKEADVHLLREENLRGNVERIEQLHAATAALLLRMQSAEEAIAGGRNSIEVSILDGPVLLSDKEWPKPKLLLAASACVGLLFGVLAACGQVSQASSPAEVRDEEEPAAAR